MQLCGLVVAMTSGVAAARDLSVYGTVTTDYVYRGVSQSDEHAAVQLGLDLSFESGWFLGAWGSTTDLTTGNRKRDREIDYYVGYTHDLERNWSFGVTLNRYGYPGSGGNVGYDYNEYMLSINYADRAWLDVSYTNEAFGHASDARGVELTTRWPLAGKLEFTAGAGYNDVSGMDNAGYAYWQFALTRLIGRASLDFRYHDTYNEPSDMFPARNSDGRIVFSISAGF